MNYSKDFSVIIPCREAASFLPGLLASIPDSERVEVIVVDNSEIPMQASDVKSPRSFTLLHSAPQRGAGGARNEGIAQSTGRWLLFADADDYFTPGAFERFYAHLNSDADMVFFAMNGVFRETGITSQRMDHYTRLVANYQNNKDKDSRAEWFLRTQYTSPCGKMVSHDLITRHALRYDEVVASNDKYFSLLSGYYANKIEADEAIVYTATITAGSLTQRREYEVVSSRLKVNLKSNRFLRQHNLSEYQTSVMHWVLLTLKARPTSIMQVLGLLLRYRQNPFVGASHWVKTLRGYRKNVERA